MFRTRGKSGAEQRIERQQSLHLYHMGGDPLVRTVKIRPPSVKCIACGPNRTIDKLEDYDYETFCSGPTSGDGFVGGTDRISAKVKRTTMTFLHS